MNINPEKLIEKLMAKVPNMPAVSDMMGGYEFKDGSLKATVEYWSDNGDIVKENEVIPLQSMGDFWVTHTNSSFVSTDLSIRIKPNNMAFMLVLTNTKLINAGSTFIFPNEKQRVVFSVISANAEERQIWKNELLGYGIFIPYIPINNISFTNQNANT